MNEFSDPSDNQDSTSLLEAKISVLKEQIGSIEEELNLLEKDHKKVVGDLENRQRRYRKALVNRRQLRRISTGEDFSHQRQNAHRIIKELEEEKHREIRSHNRLRKSLTQEKRKLERKIREIKLKLEVLKTCS